MTFTIIATVDSVCTTISRLNDQSAFLDNNFYKGLLGKCNDAQSAQARGQTNVVQNKLQDMRSQIQSPSGKGIRLSGANLMLGDIQYVLAHL